MELTFTFRNVNSSEGLKTYTKEKLEKLKKFSRGQLEIDVVYTTEKHLQTVEIDFRSDGNRYGATHSSEDMYASVDLALDKLDRQVRDRKDESDTRKKQGGISQMAGKSAISGKSRS